MNGIHVKANVETGEPSRNVPDVTSERTMKGSETNSLATTCRRFLINDAPSPCSLSCVPVLLFFLLVAPSFSKPFKPKPARLVLSAIFLPRVHTKVTPMGLSVYYPWVSSPHHSSWFACLRIAFCLVFSCMVGYGKCVEIAPPPFPHCDVSFCSDLETRKSVSLRAHIWFCNSLVYAL